MVQEHVRVAADPQRGDDGDGDTGADAAAGTGADAAAGTDDAHAHDPVLAGLGENGLLAYEALIVRYRPCVLVITVATSN